MSAYAYPLLTEQEYLELERASELKHDYYAGHMYAMAGASRSHSRITMNFAGELYGALKGTPCQVHSNDLRLRVSPGGLYTYLDVVVFCGEIQVADDHQDTLLNPVFLAEVLSPSTERYDRGLKASQYRTLPSLKEYAFVSQHEPRIEVYSRQLDGSWLLSEVTDLDASVHLTSLDCRLDLAAIYANVVFPERELPGRAR